MAFFLLFKALFERLDQLVQPAQGLQLGAVFGAQRAFEFLAQPVFGDQRLKVLVEVLQAIEIGAKRPVELVEVTLVLHQNRSRQVIKLVHVGEGHPVFQGIDQVQQFTHRNRHLGRAHFIEQIKQHAYRLPE